MKTLAAQSKNQNRFSVSTVNGTIVDNTDRLRTLAQYEIMDTPAEPSYDRVTELAAYVLDAPIALVSLIDDHRQWFKSARGVDWEETDLSVSFCGHCIQQEDSVIVVPDARQDPRFATNPLVTGAPGIHFMRAPYSSRPMGTGWAASA